LLDPTITELTAMSDRVEEFKKLNAEVVAVSVDSKVLALVPIPLTT
jgi:alkyl hydroperoxide reductase subunit AhpC